MKVNELDFYLKEELYGILLELFMNEFGVQSSKYDEYEEALDNAFDLETFTFPKDKIPKEMLPTFEKGRDIFNRKYELDVQWD